MSKSKTKAPTKAPTKDKAKARPSIKQPAKKPAVQAMPKQAPPKTPPPKAAVSQHSAAGKAAPAKIHSGKAPKYKIKTTMDHDGIDFSQLKGKKKKFYESLIRVRDEILGQFKFHSEEALDSNAASGLAGSMSNHMADYGSDNFLHEMELDMMSNEGEVLEMIDEAIDRLATADFGKCLDCGCDIPEERLEIKPYARFCVKCKARREEAGDDILG